MNSMRPGRRTAAYPDVTAMRAPHWNDAPCAWLRPRMVACRRKDHGMNSWLIALIVFIGVGVGAWLVSFVGEALRPAPRMPERLRWAPDISSGCVDLDGLLVRYIKTGAGPNLVLLHTLRTQLDVFEKIIPGLARHFTVFAFD